MNRLKILLVEDDRVSLMVYKKMLESCNYEVFHASDGFLALQMLQEQRFDLMISDNQLPFMNGTELVEKANEINAAMPALILTGNNPDDVKTSDIVAVLQKPVLPNYFRHHIQAAITNSRFRKIA